MEFLLLDHPLNNIAKSKSLVEKLRNMIYVTKHLPNKYLDVADVRASFGGTIKKFSSMWERPHTKGNIVMHPVLEAAIVKVQRRDFESLSELDKENILSLQSEAKEDHAVVCKDLFFASKALNEQRIEFSAKRT